MKEKLKYTSILVLCFALCPAPNLLAAGRRKAPAYPTLTGRETLVIAHRGCSECGEQNTIGAFRRAIRLGADGIETDLRLTRDGKLVLYHDARVERSEPGRIGRIDPILEVDTLIHELNSGADEAGRELIPVIQSFLTGIQWMLGTRDSPLVSDLSYAQLIDRIGGLGTGAAPMLDQLLKRVPSGLLDIDIKAGPRLDDLLNQVIKALRDFPDLDRVIVECPDQKSAERLRAAFGLRIKIQITPGLQMDGPYEASIRRALQFRPHSISVPFALISKDLIDRAHRVGVQVWAWTVNSPHRAMELRLMGVDAIKSDRASALFTAFSAERRRY
jgi:glycerophosphoryl diester phosphodiesterase